MKQQLAAAYYFLPLNESLRLCVCLVKYHHHLDYPPPQTHTELPIYHHISEYYIPRVFQQILYDSEVVMFYCMLCSFYLLQSRNSIPVLLLKL